MKTTHNFCVVSPLCFLVTNSALRQIRHIQFIHRGNRCHCNDNYNSMLHELVYMICVTIQRLAVMSNVQAGDCLSSC